MNKLFEYVIIYHPSDEEKKTGLTDKLLIDVQRVLAPDVNTAAMIAGRSIPEEYLNRLDRLEVSVRPF